MTRLRKAPISLLRPILLFAIALPLAVAEDATTRVPWTTSKIMGSPDPPTPFRTVIAFPHLKFDEPVAMTSVPDSNRLVVVERFGKIYTFENDTKTTNVKLFLDLGKALKVDRTESFGIAFHPDFSANGRFYVHHHRADKELPTRVSEFIAKGSGSDIRLVADHDSERLLISWPNGHNGGCVKFGPDGCLYISNGDEGALHDPNGVGQGLEELQASILRIDVDGQSEDLPYRIPTDNPFVRIEHARHEVWAYGLRNPWKFSFDRKTGEMWTADVGEDLWESVHKVKSGGNYGWSIEEGGRPFRPTRKRGPTPIEKPIVTHGHTEARSITGGYVYCGQQLSQLTGHYIYGDYDTGKVWSLFHNGEQVTVHQELCDTSMRIVGFAEDHAGELFIVDHIGGHIHKLVDNDQIDTSAEFPRMLSETGLFASTAKHQVAAGLIPYHVIAPQWTDGSIKQRFLALPDNSQIEFEGILFPYRGGRNGWKFPDGSALLETHFMEMEVGNPASLRRIETRVLQHERLPGSEATGDQLWRGFTYIWNEDQTDAELLEDPRGLDRQLLIRDAMAPGGQRQQTWHFPARTECSTCHNMAAKYVLGCQTLQLNHTREIDGDKTNQIEYFQRLGLFTAPNEVTPENLPSLVDYHDEGAPLNDRARAYLHSNCSHCHRNGGGGNADFFALASLELDQLHMLGASANHGEFRIPQPAIVRPGRPFESLIYYRMGSLGGDRMPRLGSNVVDRRGLNLIHDWIAQLNPAIAPSDDSETHQEYYQTILAEHATDLERNESIHQLIATTTGALMLARATQNGELSGRSREVAINAGTQTDSHVRNLFEQFLPEEQRTKRLGRMIDPDSILALSGDADRGKTLFLTKAGVQCRDCHRIGNQGRPVGPDLDSIGKKYDRSQILTSILEPSRNIDAQFMQYQCLTNDGKLRSGIVVERNSRHVILRDSKSETHTILTQDIDSLTPLTASMMPELLVQDLTAQQLADLVTFLDTLEP